MILQIIVGAVATFIFGMLWYGPLFGRHWMKMMKVSHDSEIMETKKRGMAGQIIVLFIFLLITAKVVSWLVPALLPLSYYSFLRSVLKIWLGFTFPVMLGAWLWDRKPFKLVLFNAVQAIISFGILSAIIYYWR